MDRMIRVAFGIMTHRDSSMTDWQNDDIVHFKRDRLMAEPVDRSSGRVVALEKGNTAMAELEEHVSKRQYLYTVDSGRERYK